MVLAKRMAGAMTEALNCDGFNLVQNNGEAAGQTVFHFHMHLIPRYHNDQAGITWTPGKLEMIVKEEILAAGNGKGKPSVNLHAPLCENCPGIGRRSPLRLLISEQMFCKQNSLSTMICFAGLFFPAAQM